MKALIAITAFTAIIFVRNVAFWSPSQTFIFGDTAIYSLQLASLSGNLKTLLDLKDSILGWNPNFLSVGIPSLSVIDNGWFYPPNWIITSVSALAGNPLSAVPLYTVSIFLHLVFSSFFVFKILREFWNLSGYASLVGSLIWLASGFNTEFSAAAPIMFAGSYLPLTTYLALKSTINHRRFFLPFFLAVALSLLAGYPMVSLIVYVFSLAVKVIYANRMENFSKKIILREAGLQALGLFAITFPMISPLYLSSYLNFPFTVRTAPLKLDAFLQNPAPLLNIPEPLLPKNTLFNTLSRINCVYLYFSLVGLIVILQSSINIDFFRKKRNSMVFKIGLIGLIISLGGVTFFPSLIYYSLPFLNVFRRLSVFTIVPSFCFSVIVAERVSAFLQSKTLSKISVFWIKILAILIVYSQVLNILYADAKDYNPFNFAHLYQSLFLSVLITVLAYLPLIYAQMNLRLAQIILIAALLTEAGSNIASKVYLNSSIDPARIFRPNTLITTLKKIVEPTERVDVLHTQHSYNTDYLGLEQTQGYLSLASQYGVEINEVLTNTDYKKENIRSVLGLRYITGKSQLSDKNLKEIYEIKQEKSSPEFFAFNYNSLSWESEDVSTRYFVYQNNNVLPRLYLAKTIRGSPTQTKELLRYIAEFDDPKNVILSNKDLVHINKVGSEGSVRIQEYKRNYLKAEVSVSEETFLANSTGFYPGWWVRINGTLVKPLQTNWFMMGTFLPPGRNIVEYLYIPYGLLAGLAYLLASFIFWLIFGLRLAANRFRKA